MIYRYSQIFLNSSLANYELGSGQYIFLISLFSNKGISQEELSSLVKIDKATTAKAIKKLVEKGYVSRITNQADKRVYELNLTEKAELCKDDLYKILDDWNSMMLDDFSAEEKEQLFSLIKKVENNLSKHYINQST